MIAQKGAGAMRISTENVMKTYLFALARMAKPLPCQARCVQQATLQSGFPG